MFNRRRLLTQDEVASAVKSAVADATTASLLNAHIMKCDEDKRELREALLRQDAERKRLHEETAGNFARLNRMVWMAAGVVGCGAALLSSQIGTSLVTRLLH